jgi:hypothetical protein
MTYAGINKCGDRLSKTAAAFFFCAKKKRDDRGVVPFWMP